MRQNLTQYTAAMISKRTFGDDQSLQLLLFRRALHNLGLDRMRTEKAENEHRLRLPNSVGSILSLSIHLRILTRISRRQFPV